MHLPFWIWSPSQQKKVATQLPHLDLKKKRTVNYGLYKCNNFTCCVKEVNLGSPYMETAKKYPLWATGPMKTKPRVGQASGTQIVGGHRLRYY